MAETHQQTRPHCLIVPYPITGHINPIIQFAKRLAHKQLHVTLALTRFLLKTPTTFPGASISIHPISDGFDDGGRSQAKSSDEYLARFQQIGQQTLSDLLQNLSNSGRPVDCVIYDPFITWVLDVAKGRGLMAAAFFTQSCAVDNIYYQISVGEVAAPLTGEVVEVAGLPAMRAEDMPSFVYDYGSHPASFRMLLGQFRGVERVDWIFINTFYELEEEVLKYWATKFSKVKAVGPTIPSIYLDKRLQDDKEYGLTLFKPMNEICTDWLNQRQPRSVIYVSFGSLAELPAAQISELAYALRACDRYYLWVIRSSEESKLPPKFLEEAASSSSKGLIVSWCNQLEVLAHEAAGCFITHCGWNSTLEALCLGVPVVAMPQWTDQSTNAKFLSDVWGIGVKVGADDKGLVKWEEIQRCVKRVMEGEDGKIISSKSSRWRELARLVVDEGGSSDKNIDEFVTALEILKLNCGK